jgi:DNA-binding MarR family transcriptional regulator
MKAMVESAPDEIDAMLKSLLVFARTATQVLETTTVEVATGKALAASKVQLIRLLGHRGAHTSSHAASFLGVSRSAVTQLVDSMVRAGYVVRSGTSRDRRETALRLTPKGRKVFLAIRREQRNIVRGALRIMPKGSLRDCARMLDRVSAALTETRGAYLQYCLQCSAHADGRCVLVTGDAECLFLARVRRSKLKVARSPKQER